MVDYRGCTVREFLWICPNIACAVFQRRNLKIERARVTNGARWRRIEQYDIVEEGAGEAGLLNEHDEESSKEDGAYTAWHVSKVEQDDGDASDSVATHI